MALFGALEVKADSVPTKPQKDFVAMVNRLGGLGAIVRSRDEAMAVIQRRLGG